MCREIYTMLMNEIILYCKFSPNFQIQHNLKQNFIRSFEETDLKLCRKLQSPQSSQNNLKKTKSGNMYT